MSRLARACGVLLLGAVTACAGGTAMDDEDDATSGADLSHANDVTPEVDDAISRLPWQNVGFGVHYKAVSPTNTNVLIIYGGYTAQDAWVERWCDEMIRQKNATLKVGHLYAVRGPNTAGYTNEEIENSKLSTHLGAATRAKRAQRVFIVAHSSGTYVADELLDDIKHGYGGVPADTVGKIALFNLDGGGVPDPALVRRFAHAFFVYGYDAHNNRYSHNADGMKALGDEFAALGGALKVEDDGSGCNGAVSGGRWCMHDTLINSKPHNPTMYDLARDYTDFAGPRRLQTSYIDALPASP
jgi:hypothetical protein